MTQPQPSDAPLRLGTRNSLLARSQSGWVARRLEELHPGLRVELVGIETRGDQLLDVPLSSTPGREFFVAELDAALLAGKVDFTVHSYKDLSLERPADLVLAATPPRANPRDAVSFAPSARARLARNVPLRIGTGSPRRVANLADFLPAALPGPGAQRRVEFVAIRGNVDTRLSRIHLPESHPRQLDAVVLALAGLSRLWADDEAKARLAPLLADARWMILPLVECPTAPAQGALAVECRAADRRIRETLAVLDHPETAAHVAREREVLAQWGGGCHQALGATSIALPDERDALHIRGLKPNGTPVAETRMHSSARNQVSRPDPTSLAPSRLRRIVGDSPESRSRSSSSAVFVANANSLSAGTFLAGDSRLWAADPATWQALARSNHWVEGSAEGLGLDALLVTLEEPILGFDSVRLLPRT